MKLSIVIPAYNEDKKIAHTITRIKEYISEHNLESEIIVVDDCSTDQTLQSVQHMSGVKILRNLKNHGKGYSVRKGVLAATGDWILFMDADNSTDIAELDKFWPQINDFDILIASRALPDSKILVSQNKIKVTLGRLGNLLIRALIDYRIHDTQCGFKFFNKKVQKLFQKLSIERFGFDFELIWLIKKNNLKIKEMPVSWTNDSHSTVKWWHYMEVLAEVFQVRFNDLLNKYR